MKRLFNFRKPVLVVILIAMTLSLVFTAVPALAAEKTAKLAVVNKINGQKIHEPREFPLDIKIFRNGKFHQLVTDLKFGQRFVVAELPAGTYKFEAFNHKTGKLVASSGSVMIKGGAHVRVLAMLNVKKVPTLSVKTK